jgi:UrcA family protein
MAFAAIAAGPIAATHADTNEIARSETVPYGDLNLASHDGTVTLYRRLHSAAADVCTDSVADQYAVDPGYRQCMQQAMGDAVAAVDRPQLTAYAQARGITVASRKGGRAN